VKLPADFVPPDPPPERASYLAAAMDQPRITREAFDEQTRGPEVRVELWALTADPLGAYLVSQTPQGDGGPWLSAPVLGAGGRRAYHQAAVGLLDVHGELDLCKVLHSTGWRPTDTCLLLPYLAVLGDFGVRGSGRYVYANEAWPHARPVGRPLYDHTGKPLPHGATERPCPRDLDQLWNNLGHLRWLRDHNTAVDGALDEWWHQLLEEWRPTLAGLYQEDPLDIPGLGVALTRRA
jgi:hypothetical protein